MFVLFTERSFCLCFKSLQALCLLCALFFYFVNSFLSFLCSLIRKKQEECFSARLTESELENAVEEGQTSKSKRVREKKRTEDYV